MKMKTWLKTHKFEAHLLVFLGMIIPAAGLYYAQIQQQGILTWVLLAVFTLSNIFALFIQ